MISKEIGIVALLLTRARTAQVVSWLRLLMWKVARKKASEEVWSKWMEMPSRILRCTLSGRCESDGQ